MRISVEPFLHALSDGKIIRITTAWVLRVLGVISLIGGVVWFIAILRVGFNAANGAFVGHSVGVLVGSFIFAVLGLCWGYLCFSLCMFRARSTLELGDSRFTVLPILSILLRLNGEIFFVTYSLMGVGSCLFIWFADFSPLSEFGSLGSFPFMQGESSGFIGGVEFAVLGLLVAFIGIVISYALAELSVVLVEIATNTQRIPVPASPAAFINHEQARLSTAPASVPTHTAASSTSRSADQGSCKQCGQTAEPGASFCAECGGAIH